MADRNMTSALHERKKMPEKRCQKKDDRKKKSPAKPGCDAFRFLSGLRLWSGRFP
jgi:hypothetical protein